MTSTIPAVKAKLVELAAETLTSSQIIYGPITAVTTTGPRIVTVGRVFGTRAFDSLDRGTASERYTVDLAVSVDLAGTDQQTADDQALADYAALEAAIREYPGGDLGVSGVLSADPTGEFELREAADDNGRHAVVVFTVLVLAQTT